MLLFRHSETALNLEHRFVGARTNSPLCPHGVLLAQEQAKRLAQMHFSPPIVLVSPMLRCRETASILFPGVPQVVVPDLHECDFGLFEGKSREELREDETYRAWRFSGDKMAYPGGESMAAFTKRCKKAILWAKNTYGEDLTGVFHGGTILAVCAGLFEGRMDFSVFPLACCEWIYCRWRGDKIVECQKGGLPKKQGEEK